MEFIKALFLVFTRPLWCSFAGIKRAIVFKYLDWKEQNKIKNEQ